MNQNNDLNDALQLVGQALGDNQEALTAYARIREEIGNLRYRLKIKLSLKKLKLKKGDLIFINAENASDADIDELRDIVGNEIESMKGIGIVFTNFQVTFNKINLKKFELEFPNDTDAQNVIKDQESAIRQTLDEDEFRKKNKKYKYKFIGRNNNISNKIKFIRN